MEIKAKKIWVTGANRGIGRALAEMFARNGAHLSLLNRSQDEADELIADLTQKGAASVRILKVDLSDPKNIEQMLKATANEEVDILVNNAGQMTGGLLEDQPIEEIRSMFNVNVQALVHLTHAILPRMLKQESGGKIVNNSSVSALMYFPSASTYAASKAAVSAFTQCLRAELQDTKVSTLLLFTPGVETRMFGEIAKKYGRNMDLGFLSGIPASAYADMVKEAILEDLDELKPSGVQGVGLNMAQHLPKTFQKMMSLRFKRSPKSDSPN